MSEIPVFTQTSAYSLGFVAVVGVVAYILANTLLPRSAKWQDRVTFVWLVSTEMLDLSIHTELHVAKDERYCMW